MKKRRSWKLASMVWMFMTLQNLYVENLMSKAMVLRGGAFERWLGHEGGTLIIGICALLTKGPSVLPHTFHHVKIPQRSLQLRRRQSPDRAGTLISDFQPPELWEINFYCL